MQNHIVIPPTEFLKWLRTQPADETYDYVNGCDCPIARYLKERGHTNVSVGGYGEFHTAQGRGSAEEISNALNPAIDTHLNTYGAAADRLAHKLA